MKTQIFDTKLMVEIVQVPEINPIINRTLTHGSFTARVATRVAGPLLSLRERLQRGMKRLKYGGRDEPYLALSRLGQRLEATLVPEVVLPTIVDTVKEAFRLPYVAITLRINAREPDADPIFDMAASAGQAPPAALASQLHVLPLQYHGELAGQLILAPHTSGEPLSAAELGLLTNLICQAETAVHLVQLTADLHRSREQLVLAREEERRRLRNELHDGIGPQLAGLVLKAETARNMLAHDSQADALLSDLAALIRTTVADIRRVVRNLRPPTLDQLGLVAALRELAISYDQFNASGVQMYVEAPETLPPLPAAVEVAIFRIAQESLTNVARHAQARTCYLRLTLNETTKQIYLSVQDDGRGIQPVDANGIGLSSIRGRTAELGGACLIEPAPQGGTIVGVQLPIG